MHYAIPCRDITTVVALRRSVPIRHSPVPEAVCDQLALGQVVEPVELPAAVLRLVEVSEAGDTPLQLPSRSENRVSTTLRPNGQHQSPPAQSQAQSQAVK